MSPERHAPGVALQMHVHCNGNKRISRLNPSSWKILKNSWPWVIPHEKMLRIEIERAYKSFTFVVLWFGSFINRVNPKIIRAMDWRLLNISNGQASQWRRHYVDGQVTYLNTTFYLALVFGVPQKRHLNTKGRSESFLGGIPCASLRAFFPSAEPKAQRWATWWSRQSTSACARALSSGRRRECVRLPLLLGFEREGIFG